ncbi:MAG: SRPBCC domain-containing protein [Bacteroidia bacterium]
MEPKTKINAHAGKQELVITREFDLPVEQLFQAHTEPELIEQWMNTKVLKQENKKHGSWQFETRDPKGNIVFKANGTIHEFIPNRKITRTFEMENAFFGVQLELLTFEKITEDASKLTIQSIYESVALRDQILKLPFAYGLNMAHDKLETILHELKK